MKVTQSSIHPPPLDIVRSQKKRKKHAEHKVNKWYIHDRYAMWICALLDVWHEICELDEQYIDMKVSKSAITMISAFIDSSRKHVVENSLSLCVYKCCHKMTLKTLVDMQQLLICLSLIDMTRVSCDGTWWYDKEDESIISWVKM